MCIRDRQWRLQLASLIILQKMVKNKLHTFQTSKFSMVWENYASVDEITLRKAAWKVITEFMKQEAESIDIEKFEYVVITGIFDNDPGVRKVAMKLVKTINKGESSAYICLLYTSPSPRDS
eukprot:TRINITY_DN20463_c0_g1_i1.p1 TRINITY_DN20463_c0_g1~~TRINITY_DN20463_c0_g1_i1.p1  ORF type:complete len:134 (+),score=15.32 TRINITY_DN20463_c0_g1_i1:42-404(+)